ncbi:MAG: DHH family phosphoesterase [Nanoarchaeota archaeon]|nr:DHH family phosphoesterase [Nanoarchaeota archaeon]
MLSEAEIKSIRNHLEKAQNPLFFFDNDDDGLCAFLLFRRFIERGKGIAIKSFPDLNASYARKIHELKPDYIFILDKPIVSEGFLKEAQDLGLGVVWVDHHDVPFPNLEQFSDVHYFNSMRSEKPSSEPVTYWAYKIAGKKEDLWLALAGCIGDGYLPEFAEEAEKKYPELWRGVSSAFEGLYSTGIGKIARILSFALKDRTSNVVNMMKTMFKATPQDVLLDSKKNLILERFSQINLKYEKLVEKAKLSAGKGKLAYFQYGGDLSISAEIANELSYLFSDKIVVVAYLSGTKANLSLRGKNIKEITLKAIEGIENARGGGHKDATGAQMNVEDLPRFKENIERLIK